MDPDYLPQLFGLDGKVALITGASGGIGASLARGFARAGARVVVHGRSDERLEELRAEIGSAGGSAAVVAGDIGDPEACRALVDRTCDAFGGIDILVNCAGMNRRQPIAEVDEATYERIMAVNLRGPYFVSQQAAPVMRDRGGGAIVHIGSLTCAIGLATVSVYGMTKAALAELTRTQAIEWAEYGIRVNCLCPGFIMTPLTEQGIFGDERKRRWVLDRIPLGRPGSPDEMVGMAILLASGAASYMTGQTVYLDGGLLAGSVW